MESYYKDQIMWDPFYLEISTNLYGHTSPNNLEDDREVFCHTKDRFFCGTE